MLTVSTGAFGAPVTVIHTFTGGAADGRYPRSLLLDGSVLYGSSAEGGINNAGAVYRINTDGSGFGLLHAFTNYQIDGQQPWGNLAISGTTLYGTTSGFGGSVYKVDTNGSNFARLHAFAFPGGNPSEPRTPEAGLVVAGNTLYGTTAFGGANNIASSAVGGTVFSLATNGSSYTPIHEFPGNATEGNTLHGIEMLLDGQTLYGMTTYGGAASPGAGTVFRVNIDGSGYSTLHSFDGIANFNPADGADPWNTGLKLVGNRLYGVTLLGGYTPQYGMFNNGALFAINTDGSGFEVLHSFGGGTDGVQPSGSMAIVGTTLYGTTRQGGAHNLGTIYKINLDGTGYVKLHDFAGGPNDGAFPWQGGLVVDGNTLYGTTLNGGTYDLGVVYTLTIPEPVAITIVTPLGVLWLIRRNNRP
jgi:uncharacterized repeat protein (TIGR03803 family)